MYRKFKLTKKKIVSLAVIVMFMSIAAAGTLAYFTDTGVAHNVITTGKIDITLNDKTIRSGQIVDFPEEGILGVIPGATVDKIVSVTNNSAGEAYIRIRLDTYIVGADGSSLPLTVTDKNGSTVPALVLHFMESENWLSGTDGNWYYAVPVASGATTDVLFDTVSFAFALGNEYQNSVANIVVTAEAVQTVNNPIPEGGTVEDVSGWPEA